MKNAVLLHGLPYEEEYLNPNIPSPSNSHWFPWLQHQLLLNGILTQTPEMPNPLLPVYEEWKDVFEQFRINEETILIGHSLGAGFLIRWLSENDVKVGPIFLIAPWIDPQHIEQNVVGDFFNFEMDPSLPLKTNGVDIFVSTDDEDSVLQTVSILESTLKGCSIHTIDNMGHFTIEDMGTPEFPELLKMIIGEEVEKTPN